ncbi:FAD-dependent oxidoreductase [Bacillus horti]|uniref:FAD-dependent oxidoreductase n=2 Tax=Caldalkalibacillus horti TaxID=77523 RepID=A0ABT9VTR4_9BACI|nr:FAD-dependent oxidoreductase [Bacillus horti]MDQ0164378.1 hypothetical protein [Bacillus horti]
MKKKIVIVVCLLVLAIPLVIYGGWKVTEWRAMRALGGVSFEVEEYVKNITQQEYDVIVVGGDPEGVAAAVAAAREGAKTLLLEPRDGLGGLMTYGALNFIDYDFDMNDDIANEGVFKEWHELVGGQVVFDIETAKDAFLKLVQDEENIDLSLTTEVLEPIMSEDGTTILGVVAEDENGTHSYYGQRIIDATQHADLAAMANVPYFIGGADIGLENRKMAVTLMVHLDNVNWDGIAYTALTKKFGEAKFTQTAAWGFVDLHHAYTPVEEGTRLRGLNVARQSDNSIYINALHIFDVDGLDPASIEEGIERGKREIEGVVQFLREEFPGFKRAEVASYPTELYIRETRHIYAEYQLPIVDVWEQKDHWDSIGFGSYPVDIQATSVHDYGYVLTHPTQYAIPFRSLVPLEIDGLLVASKSSGYSSLAAGSARIIPTGMSTAQAAGVAAALSIREDISFRELAANRPLINELQELLKEQGALLYAYDLDFPYKGKWFYPAIKKLLTYGLVSGGHQNDLHVENTMSELEFVNLLTNGFQRISPQAYENHASGLSDIHLMAQKDKTPLSRNQASRFLLTVFGESREGDAWAKVVDQDLVDEEIVNRLVEEKNLLRSEGYVVVAHILQKIEQLYQ